MSTKRWTVKEIIWSRIRGLTVWVKTVSGAPPLCFCGFRIIFCSVQLWWLAGCQQLFKRVGELWRVTRASSWRSCCCWRCSQVTCTFPLSLILRFICLVSLFNLHHHWKRGIHLSCAAGETLLFFISLPHMVDVFYSCVKTRFPVSTAGFPEGLANNENENLLTVMLPSDNSWFTVCFLLTSDDPKGLFFTETDLWRLFTDEQKAVILSQPRGDRVSGGLNLTAVLSRVTVDKRLLLSVISVAVWEFI